VLKFFVSLTGPTPPLAQVLFIWMTASSSLPSSFALSTFTDPFLQSWSTIRGDRTRFSASVISNDYSREEIQLAFRNHGAHLEVALAHDVTPISSHYQLLHWDIPNVDPVAFRLIIGGCVQRNIELTLTQLKAMPCQSIAVTLECAGNGRTNHYPRHASVPWNDQAFGTAIWTGVLLTDVLKLVDLQSNAIDLVFTGLDTVTSYSILSYHVELTDMRRIE
jgi:hypothetical protein